MVWYLVASGALLVSFRELAQDSVVFELSATAMLEPVLSEAILVAGGGDGSDPRAGLASRATNVNVPIQLRVLSQCVVDSKFVKYPSVVIVRGKTIPARWPFFLSLRPRRRST